MNEKNRDKLRDRLYALVQQWRRKAWRKFYEWDHDSSQKLEKRLRRMKPQELDQLLNE